MGKNLFIAEKPSVAREFAKALQITGSNRDGYIESNDAIVTWCVGHLVTMSYPEVYDEKYKRWSLNTIPFIPTEFKYEVIDSVKKQFQIVSGLLNRKDVETIVDAALDRHLAPLRRALAARNETEPTLRDIVGGLGWIMGLVGIGLYFSRRRP